MLAHAACVGGVLGAGRASAQTPATVPGPSSVPSQTQAAPAALDAMPALPATEDWAVHAQSTFTDQYHPAFTAAYNGPNSLDPGSRGDETFDATIFAGFRPWRGGEIWVNGELDQGFGLNDTLGLAGFSSAEAYKVGEAYPYVRLTRLFLRQTFDLGGAVQGVDPDQNVLGGTQTANRVVVTIGKISVPDVFDTNKYAHDARNDFLNWAVIDGGAFDYAADAWGYTYGGALEWYQDWWTLRTGYFEGSVTPNSPHVSLPLGRQFQLLSEAEGRYRLFGQDSKLKLLGFMTRAKLGTFSELEQFYTANPEAADNIILAEAVRHLRNKFGGEINLEQPITADLGAFLRASLNDGRTESYDFTDITRSLSGGLSLAGTAWGRKDDTVGTAFVVNNISHGLKDYLADGFLGILVGDGKLTNAGPEQICETFYSYAVRSGVEITADYQLVNHPAYNVDRGPVSILGLRLHAQF
jgi:high affinity Mn2+ porin